MLAPLFGERLSGSLGNAVDIIAVIATILGTALMPGLGVEQFVSVAPFVGLFLAHISKGRTIREIAIGAVMRLLRAKQTDPEPDRRQLP